MLKSEAEHCVRIISHLHERRTRRLNLADWYNRLLPQRACNVAVATDLRVWRELASIMTNEAAQTFRGENSKYR